MTSTLPRATRAANTGFAATPSFATGVGATASTDDGTDTPNDTHEPLVENDPPAVAARGVSTALDRVDCELPDT